MFFRRLFVVTAIAMFLTGCAKMPVHKFSIQNTRSNSSESLVIDAEKRVVLTGIRIQAGERLNPQTNKFEQVELPVVCSEPSPDAISAAALSLAAKANSADKVGAELALSHAQSTSYIGLRTQTIQLLRDGMYRLCEGYLSGALNPASFNELHRRYQNLMMGLLAVELLTNTVVAPQVSLQSAITTANTGGGAEAKDKVNDYANAKATTESLAKEDQAAQEAVKSNQTAITTATDTKKAEAQKNYDNSVKKAAEVAHKYRAAQITEQYYKEALTSTSQVDQGTQTASNSGISTVHPAGISKVDAETNGISKAVIKIVEIIINESFQREECNRKLSNITGIGELKPIELATLEYCKSEFQEKLEQYNSIQLANKKVQDATPEEVEKAKEDLKKTVDDAKKINLPSPDPGPGPVQIIKNPTGKPCLATLDQAQVNAIVSGVENSPAKVDGVASGASTTKVAEAPCETPK